MAKLVFGMNQSLDGYTEHQRIGPPVPEVFRHFVQQVRSETGMVYGRGLYEVMRYWDDDQAGWSDDEREFAAAWRSKPKWVLSRSLTSVGPNATLITGDAVAAVRKLKAELDGELGVGGPVLAQSLTEAGLIDEYRLYLHPVVLGGGKPFFVGAAPRLRLVGQDVIANVIRLTYVPDAPQG